MVLKSKFNAAVLSFSLACSGLCLAQQTTSESLKDNLVAAKTDTAKANVYNRLADYFKQSQPDSVAFYAQKAEALSAKINYTPGLANAYINQGNFNIITGKYKNALNQFKKAQTAFEKLLDEDPDNKEFKNGLARAFASSGVVYSEESNHYMALENYQKALKLYEETGKQTDISKALNNIGIVYKAQQDYPKALEYLKKAQRLQNQLGEKNEPVTLTNIGVIYFETKQYDQALKY